MMAYEAITRYAGKLAADPGKMTDMVERDGVWSLPQYDQSKTVESFQEDFYHLGAADQDYFETLRSAGVDMSEIKSRADLEGLDAQTLLAALTFCIRSERFGEGNLYVRIVSGLVDDLLGALAEIDGGRHAAVS